MMKMTKCNNCGAEIELQNPKCPYCNAINEIGAENRYMENLDELKEDLSELPEEAENIYKKEMAGGLKKVLVISAVIAVLLLLIGGSFFLYERYMEKKYSYDPKVQLMWQREYYPQFDKLYAEKNYDAIVEIMDETYEDEGYSIYNWEHSNFILKYQGYQTFMERVDYMTDKETANKKTAQFMVGDAMLFLFFTRESDYLEEEWTMMQEWVPDYEKVLYEDMKFTKEEAEELYEKINDNGFIDYEECDKYTAKIWKRFIKEGE